MSELNGSKKAFVESSNINYFDLGNGEIVLLLHGITTYSFIWRNIAHELSKKYRVIVPDLLGCGDSDKPLNISYSLKNQASIFNQFMKTLGHERFHLVGHDLGGGISQIMAVTNTAIIDLTLINSVAYDYWPVQPITALRTPIIRHLIMGSLDFGTFRLIVQRGLYNKELCNNELMDHFFKPFHTSEGKKAFLHFARCLNNNDLLEISEKLHSLSIPVLIIRGVNDVYLNSEIPETLNKNIQNSKLICIEKAGHFIQEDDPQSIIDSIQSFYNQR